MVCDGKTIQCSSQQIKSRRTITLKRCKMGPCHTMYTHDEVHSSTNHLNGPFAHFNNSTESRIQTALLRREHVLMALAQENGLKE
jgi:hypothetical protein